VITVGLTGATGTVGRALLPLLEGDEDVDAVLAVGTREWDPSSEGLEKVTYSRVDVRDRDALERAWQGANAVVHLAFSYYGLRRADRELHEINVQGTENAFRAARAVGAKRFVYTGSTAAYGWHPERNGHLLGEDAPLRPSSHFYSAHKAEAEGRLRALLEEDPGMDTWVLRPTAVVGPHTAGEMANVVPPVVRRLGLATLRALVNGGLRPFSPTPGVGFQFVHEEDVAQAIGLALHAQGPPGAYNLAGEDVVSGPDMIGRLGLRRFRLPGSLTRTAAAASARLADLPLAPPGLAWAEALRTPLLVDSSKAREELRWRPRHTSASALDATREAAGI
jgi:nucleoside-diphosphate-sugar epimerase